MPGSVDDIDVRQIADERRKISVPAPDFPRHRVIHRRRVRAITPAACPDWVISPSGSESNAKSPGGCQG